MKKVITLSLLLAGLLGATQPTLASPEKVKPGKPKPIERTRRHLHRASMQRVQRARAQR